MNSRAEQIIVAADGGGTGCRACAGTLADGILAEAQGGPGNVHSDFQGAIANLTGAVKIALAKAGLGAANEAQLTAHFGVAGAHTEVEMEAVRAVLPYGQARVTGDRATSVRGVLGEADGFVVALGTGTIIARQKLLEMRTVGGWGFDLSDQASGSWLGHRVARAAVLCEDGLQAHTALTRKVLELHAGLMGLVHFSATATPGTYAPLAREVVAAAKSGDAVGTSLMQDGAKYIETALTHLGFNPGDVLSLAGGLGPHYAPYLSDRFTGNLVAPKGSALEGAFAMAAQAAR